MIKILFITPDFYPNSTGFANACINLVETIKKYGAHKYEVHIYTEASLGDHAEYAGAHILRYTKIGENKISRFLVEMDKVRTICDYVEKNDIDIIFFETNTFPFFETSILKRYKGKCIVRIHSTADTEVPVYGKKNSLGMRYSVKKINEFMHEIPYIIATSNFYIDFIRDKYLKGNVYSIWDNKNYGILYNTSNTTEYKKKVIMDNTFLTMGKMSENGLTQKGIIDLLKATYLLKKRNLLPADFRLVIVGNGVKLEYVQKYIQKLHIQNRCSIIESATHDEVFELIRSSKAIILASRYEGQSMFITESLSMGKPLILSKNNGMGDMLIENINGFGIRAGDIEDIAYTLSKMMNLDKNVLEKMGDESRKLYNSKFSPEKIYEQFDVLMTLKD